VGRPGQGTFVQRSLSQSTPGSLSTLTRRLDRWITAAQAAGLDDDGIMDVVRATMRQSSVRDSA
jgi:GntR family transcriptional regulator